MKTDKKCFGKGTRVFGTNFGQHAAVRKRKRASFRAYAALVLGALGLFSAGGVARADVVVSDKSAYGNTVTKTGNIYEIQNQQISTDKASALNRFSEFNIAKAEVANLRLGNVSHQINLVDSKINIDGVVNALKDNKIAGDVYFFSNSGIAVGATGVINVGQLTLGSNTIIGEIIFKGYSDISGVVTNFDTEAFYNASGADRAARLQSTYSKLIGSTYLQKSGTIDVAGTINATQSVFVMGNNTITVAPTGKIYTGAVFKDLVNATYDDYRAPLINTSGVMSATEAEVTKGGIVLFGRENVTVKGTLSTNVSANVKKDGKPVAGESIVLQGKNLTVEGAKMVSDGGKILLTASTDEAKLQADPTKDPENGGFLVIKDAYIDSGSANRDAGDIEITSVRTAMGVARVDVDDSTITAAGQNSNHAGDVTIHATAQTELWNWDIGDGAYAQIKMGQKGTNRNTIIGDNVDITAASGSKGNIADKSSEHKKTQAEREAEIDSLDEATLGDTVTALGKSLTALASITITNSAADVDIDKTDISAVGSTETEGTHGDLTIKSDAAGEISTLNLGPVGFGFAVGKSRVSSQLNVDYSTLYAEKDTTIKAAGRNNVSVSMKELNFIDDKHYAGVDVAIGILDSDVDAKVGEHATITSGNNVSVTAVSERRSETASNASAMFAVSMGLGIAETHADAELAGTVYAGGDVDVKAETTLEKPSEDSSYYYADSVSSIGANGDSTLKPTVDKGKELAGKFGKWLKEKFLGKAEAAGNPVQNQAKCALSDKTAINAGLSLLISQNDSHATVSGTVRGINTAKENGKYTGNDELGAKSLSVYAHTLSRTSNISGAYQYETERTGGAGHQYYVEKENAGALALSFTLQENHSEAAITGDTKTIGDTTVKATTEIPWKTIYQSSLTDILKTTFFDTLSTENAFLQHFVDSWGQAAGKGTDAQISGSIVWMNYDNSAKAYIGKKSDNQTTAPSVYAGGNVNVLGTTDITTVNFAGSVPTLFNKGFINIWKGKQFADYFNATSLDPSKVGEDVIGGSLLYVLQENKTDAYIDDGAEVTTAGDVKVKANTEALNLGMTVAGSSAQSVAVDGSFGLSRIKNETNARIENATVNAAALSLVSEDRTRHINLAGGVGVSGATGIGASIAYNGITRTTKAILSGDLTIAGDTDVSAKNTGTIAAVSVAGAVTYDGKKGNAGSRGVRLPGGGGENEDAEDGMGIMMQELFGNDENPLGLAEDAIEDMGGADFANADEVADQKNSWSVAANISLNAIYDTAKAYVASKKDKTATEIAADALRVTSGNDSLIVATSGAIAADVSVKKEGNAIAGSFVYNAIDNTNEAYIDSATLTLRGTKKKEKQDDDTEKEIDEALTVSADNEETITNVAGSGSGEGNGNAGAGQISVNLIESVTKSYLKDVTVKADEAVKVAATDDANINSYTGAFAISTDAEGNAFGASLAVNAISTDTESFATNSSFAGTAEDTASGNVTISADEKSDIASIVASAAGTGNFAGGFSISGNAIYNKVKAYVESDKAQNAGAMSVSAKNHGTATVGVGAAAVSGENAVGASLAVMVNHSTVDAHVKGEEHLANTFKAQGISIAADNSYNGSATDSDEDSTSKVVAIGASGGGGTFSGAGSLTVSHVEQTTDAYLGKGKYETAGGDVSITAKNTARLFGMAGGLSVSKGTGIGAGIDIQKYTGHTYAGMKSGLTLSNPGNVTVNAESLEKMTSVAAAAGLGLQNGGAGAAGAHDVTTDTKAFIGEDEKDAAETKLTEAGTVSVSAKDTTTLATGSGAAGASLEGSVGAGLSAAVEVIDKKAQAYIGKNTTITGTADKKSSVSVSADNTASLTAISAALGVSGGALGLAGTAAVTSANFTTKAYVGDGAKINLGKDAPAKTETDTAAPGAVNVKAHSEVKETSGVGGVGGSGEGGIGLTNSTVVFNGETEAYLGDNVEVTAKSANIAADHKTDVTYATVAAGIGGSFGVAGAAGANVFDTKTKAYTGTDVSVKTKNDTIFSATDTTALDGGNGGLAIGGGVGAGVALGVTKVTKDTEAYIGDGSDITVDEGSISVKADSKENILNISVQGAGGAEFGVAGAVNVNVMQVVTKAFTDSNVQLMAGRVGEETEENTTGGITVDATHKIERMMSGVYGASGSGGASVGAAIDVAVVHTQTNAYLGAANGASAGGDLKITATEDLDDITTNPVAAAIGYFGVTGSISVYHFGSMLSDDDKALVSAQTKKGGDVKSVDDWIDEEINKNDVSAAMDNYSYTIMSNVKKKSKDKISSKAPSTAGEEGVYAGIGGASTVYGKNISVISDEKIDVANYMGNLSGSAAASAGASVSVVTADTETTTEIGPLTDAESQKNLTVTAASEHNMENVTIGASIAGLGAMQGTVETWKDTNTVQTLIGRETHLIGGTAGDITIGATNTRNFDSRLTGASAALIGALNGAVITGSAYGSAETLVGNDIVIGVEDTDFTNDDVLPNVNVYATANTTLDAKAIGGAGSALVGGTGTGASLYSEVDSHVQIGTAAEIYGNNVNITANNTPILKAVADAYGVGLGVGVGITVAKTESKDTASVEIIDNPVDPVTQTGELSTVSAMKKLYIRAAMHKPTDISKYNAYVYATAGAGGVINGAVAVSQIDMNTETSVEIGNRISLMAGDTISIASDHEDTSQIYMDSVGAGAASGTGSDVRETIVSDSHVSVGNLTLLSSEKELTITASNDSRKDYDGNSSTTGLGAALAISGSGSKAVTNITHNTSVNVGSVIATANASDLTETEKAAGKTIYDKNAISIDAKSHIVSKDDHNLVGTGAVPVAHIANENIVTANTSVNVANGSTFYAGDTSEANASTQKDYMGTNPKEFTSTYRGGSIGIGARNDADISSSTTVDVGGLAGYAGSSNDVKYNNNTDTTFGGYAETAMGDISVSAGRDSSGNAGTINVKANSDILCLDLVPLTYRKDPLAQITSVSNLKISGEVTSGDMTVAGASLNSDRDIYLRANNGTAKASATGEVRSWVSHFRDACTDAYMGGDEKVSETADVEMNGEVQTGIHRNKQIHVGGTMGADGRWVTTIESSGGISYRYSESKSVDSDLFTRYDELKRLLSDYGGDDGAKAAYQAELEFLEEKMVEAGLGYYETVTDQETGEVTAKRFIRMAYSGTSELSDAKAIVNGDNDEINTYKENINKQISNLNTQLGKLEEIKTAKTDYNTASEAAADAAATKEGTARAVRSAEFVIKSAAFAEGISFDEYIAKYPTEKNVMEYNACVAADTAAQKDNEAAQTALSNATKTYSDNVTAYNKAYTASFSDNPMEFSEGDYQTERDQVNMQKENCNVTLNKYLNSIEDLKLQIKATDAFFTAGGTESDDGIFTKDGNTVKKVDATGVPVSEDAEGGYYLLHSNVYRQMTHDIEIGDITSVIGDVLFEGKNVTGTGSIISESDASVSITNNSPNHLKVGNVYVVGRVGTSGTDQGGGVYYNGYALKDTAKTIAQQIQSKNKDTTKTVLLKTVRAEDGSSTIGGTPTVTVSNSFKPKNYLDDDSAPMYMASDTILAGYIYNPRGSVTVTGEYGDVTNKSTIYAGSVEINVKNGDYIQSYDTARNGSITSVGGNPIASDGSQVSSVGPGIQANGNILITARYLNINSDIISGIASRDVTIPKDYALYYMNGNDRKYVTAAEITADIANTIYVADKDGNTIDSLTYDAKTGRFVLDDVEMRGGHISLVGTILNTTPEKDGKAAARIEALDGYGSITVINNSDKDLELGTLSTGEGKEGKIEITDLDRSTGKILRKTTYTRNDEGNIVEKIQEYVNGEPPRDSTLIEYDDPSDVVEYAPATGSYYNYQIGQDQSATYTYTLNDTRWDFWGIADKTPTGQEMLDQGARLEETPSGDAHQLNGGAFIGTSNNVGEITTKGEQYQVSKVKVEGTREQTDFVKESTRLWYTFWLAKKYNYKLVEKATNTDITQYSVKADHKIGIGFSGNATGGTITVKGNNQNVLLSGDLITGAGTVDLSGNNITRETDTSLIRTGTLAMTAAGNAGTADKMIRTNAANLSGSATGGNFAVDVVSGSVNLGNISAGETVSVKAQTGDIIQEESLITVTGGGTITVAPTTVTGKRIELNSAGGVYGTDASGNIVSFKVATGQNEGAAYGLKVNAVGDINIENTNGDLYIDSVISENGSVSLKTNGSFLDNNFTDYTNESATEKLLHWTKEAVLENASTTVDKQKKLLTSKVRSKYNDYAIFKNYVTDGKFVPDDTMKETMRTAGMTDADIETYVSEKQARYEELIAAGVDKWTTEGVTAYLSSIENATDEYAATGLFGNASLQESALSADTYLTVDEKADCLVGSAVSAKALLVTLSPGSIKEGITDTNVSLKEIPHVSGTSVSLIATGKTDDKGNTVGNIGEKKTGITIDLSNPETLTAEEMLALSTAERGDFSIDGNKVTVTSVRPIDAETSGVMTAIAENGAIYLSGIGGFTAGSTFQAKDEIRLKTSGNLAGITVGSDTQTVIESGSGAISDVTVTGTGVLTARAKNGVAISKEDGDLIINTVYASDGDVSLNLNGKGSLLAVFGNDDEEEGTETGTTFLNIEGENITITDATNIKGQETEGAAENTNSVGMKVTGHKNEDGTTTAGKISAQTQGTTDVTIFGESASANTKISGATTTLTNRGHISAGTYTGTESLTVYNTKDGKISGGTFIGGSETSTTETNLALTNAGTISGGTFTAEDNVSVTNSGTMSGAVVTANKDISVSNSGTIENMNFTAKNNLTVSNTGSVKNTNLTATTGTMAITNSENGTMSGGTYSAKNDLTYTATGKATGTDLTVSSDSGKVTMTSDADLSVKKLSAVSADIDAKSDVKVDEAKVSGTLDIKADKNLTAGTATAGSANLDAGETLNVTKLTTTDNATLKSVGNLSVTTLKAGSADIDTNADANVNTAEIDGLLDIKADKNLTVGTATAGSANLDAGETLNVTKLTTTDNATLKSSGDLSVTTLKAASADIDTNADAKITKTETSGALDIKADKNITLTTATAGSAKLDAGETLNVTTLTTTDDANLKSGGAMNVTTFTTTNGDATLTSGGDATLTTITSGKNLTISSQGKLTAETLSAVGKADLDSVGDFTITTLKAASADIDTNADAKVNTAEIDGLLDIKADKNITLTTATAGSAKLDAGETLNVTKLTTTDNATLKSVGDLTILALKAGSADIDTNADAKITKAEITDDISASADGKLDIDLLTAKNADLDSGETMTVLDAEIGNTLSMNSGKDIVVNRTNAVATTMTAKGSIKTTGTNATISSETATLTAGENIELTSRSPVAKLDDVDTTEEADDVTGAGNAGSIFYAKAGTTDFDTSGKGDNVLSVKDSAKISGKTVEIDTLKGGNKIDITADNLGIDDLQTNANSIDVSVNGQNGKQTHYAGIHTTADVPVTITDSAIEYLDFTGKDDIGITNTNLGGDSTIRTNYINFELQKNPANTKAEKIGTLRFRKYGIITDIDFSRIDNGLPVNGKSPARTAYSQMMESLYDNYLGWDGDEKEEEETEETPGGIRFGKVSEKESYRAISRL